LKLRLTHEEIAQMIGLSREPVRDEALGAREEGKRIKARRASRTITKAETARLNKIAFLHSFFPILPRLFSVW